MMARELPAWILLCAKAKLLPKRHFSSGFSCNKRLNPKEAKTLAIENSWKRRTIREAIEIKVHDSSMNRGVGKFTISPIWDIALT